MARGNQREVARAKAAKEKQTGAGQKKTGNVQQRNEADAKALAAKIAAKAAQKEGGADANVQKPVGKK